MSRLNMSQSFDHISIFTRILSKVDSNLIRIVKKRVWKLLNMIKLRKTKKKVFLIRSSSNIIEIDEYVKKIQNFMQTMIEEFVSWAMFNRYAKSFWNKNCDEITKKTKRLRHICFATHKQHDWSNYMKSIDRKHKIINKIKRLNFREEIKKQSIRLRIFDYLLAERRTRVTLLKRFSRCTS
jgi:hypothetical protein